jgi:hypothetical protein
MTCFEERRTLVRLSFLVSFGFDTIAYNKKIQRMENRETPILLLVAA